MGFAIGHADQHEPAAANVARGRMNHRQRESHSDSGVDGIASSLQNFHTNMGRELMHGDHHRMLGTHWVGGRRADRNGEQ